MSTAPSPWAAPLCQPGGFGRPEGLHYYYGRSANHTRGPRRTHAALHRLEQHALRPADRSNRQKTPFPYAVVNRSPRDAEQFGRVVERDTSTDTGFKTLLSHWLRHRH